MELLAFKIVLAIHLDLCDLLYVSRRQCPQSKENVDSVSFVEHLVHVGIDYSLPSAGPTLRDLSGPLTA